MRDHLYFTYMLASRPFGTLYTGVSNDLMARTWEHRAGDVAGLTRQYAVKRLVWFEDHTDINAAIRREKQIKRWRRNWKIALIEETNPNWIDLYPGLLKAGWRANR
jgi:putative endonuclease